MSPGPAPCSVRATGPQRGPDRRAVRKAGDAFPFRDQLRRRSRVDLLEELLGAGIDPRELVRERQQQIREIGPQLAGQRIAGWHQRLQLREIVLGRPHEKVIVPGVAS